MASGKALTLQEKKERALAKIAQREESQESQPVVTNTGKVKTRSRRNTFNGTEGKMRVANAVPSNENWHWINDSPGRINQAVDGGYEFVTAAEAGGMTNSNATDRNVDLGDKVRVLVGRQEDGGPLFAYLMKIPKDWFEEDQSSIQQRNDMVDDAIRRGKKPGNDDQNFYSRPGENIIKTN